MFILNTAKIGKALGTDGILNKMLKSGNDRISTYSLFLFALFSSHHLVSIDWNKAIGITTDNKILPVLAYADDIIVFVES